MDLYEEAFRATVVLLAASVVVIAPGAAGFGGSPLLVAVGLVVAGGLYAARDRLGEAPDVGGHDLGYYGRTLWVAGVVATGVFLVGLSTTPGELRALGGIVGLVGMANYFLRPVYLGVRFVFRTFFGSPA
jgi:hypothetical protein